jgi:hypothetical protein
MTLIEDGDLEEFEQPSFAPYSHHPQVYEVADRLLEGFFAIKQRTHRKKYLVPARKLICALWSHPRDEFRFPTGDTRFSEKGRTQVWHVRPVKELFIFLRDQMNPPWVTKVLNHISPFASKSSSGMGKSAVYRRSEGFMSMMSEVAQRDMIVDEEANRSFSPLFGRVEYRTHDGLLRPVPVKYKRSADYRQAIEVLRQHYELLRKASIWGSDGLEVSSAQYFYVRKFKGGTDVTGRFYAPFVNLPKKERLGIRFYKPEGANETIPVSIDLTALHPMMLMRMNPERTNYDALYDLHGSRDIYDVDGFEHLDRAVHKTLFMVIINTKGPDASIHRALAGCEYFEQDGEILARLRGKRGWKGEKAFPDDQDGAKRYLEAYKKRHPDLVPYIGSGMGVKLQKMDSDMMLETLRLATEAQIPLLPVHDEVICPIDRANELKEILAQSFKAVMGNDSADYGAIPVKAELPPRFGSNKKDRQFQILIKL